MLEELVAIVHAAGKEILRTARDPSRVRAKADMSPLTVADRTSHRILRRGLLDLAPTILVVSEESSSAERMRFEGQSRFWLVDPLDGTKEFLKGTGEYTVNVALVEDGRPTLGIVHAPALGLTYIGSEETGAQAAEGKGGFTKIRARSLPVDTPTVVASRDHSGAGVVRLVKALGPGTRFSRAGSSLKFCLISEGRADVYLRDGPTMEWDTAAAQCVLERAGGGVFTPAGERLSYAKDSLLNPAFLAVGDPSGPWRDWMGHLTEAAPTC